MASREPFPSSDPVGFPPESLAPRRLTICVWDSRDGDLVKILRDATDEDLDEIEQQYDEPWHDIQVEDH